MPIAPPSSLVLAVAMITALAALQGCNGEEPAAQRAPTPAATGAELVAESETFERRPENCDTGEECASVSITREVFARRPALNDTVKRRLLAQLQAHSDEPAAGPGLEAIAAQFLDEADAAGGMSSAHWLLSGEARRLSRQGEVLTVEISSYRYTGGAHGMPAVEWLNWDLASDEELALGEVIREGAQQEFWERARAAHGQWLEQQGDMGDGSGETWPFQRTSDFRFGENGLVLLYEVYALGPYAMGPVQLTIPWADLAGVVRDRYLPSR